MEAGRYNTGLARHLQSGNTRLDELGVERVLIGGTDLMDSEKCFWDISGARGMIRI